MNADWYGRCMTEVAARLFGGGTSGAANGKALALQVIVSLFLAVGTAVQAVEASSSSTKNMRDLLYQNLAYKRSEYV